MDVAGQAQQHEEVKNGMDKLMLCQGVDHCPGNIEKATHKQPYHRIGGIHSPGYLQQGFEGNQHDQSHQHVGGGLEVAVALQRTEADEDAGECDQPYHPEDEPAPERLIPQQDQREGRVAGCDQQVDGGMVEMAKPCLAQWLLHIVVERGSTHAADHPQPEEGKSHYRP